MAPGLCAMPWGTVHCFRGHVHCFGGSVHSSRDLCIAQGLCTVLWGLCTLPLGLSTPLQSLWALFSCCVHRHRGSVSCCHLAATLRNCSLCRSCCPLPSSRTLPAAGWLHHCHVAAFVSISAMAAHCLCLRTHQHEPGPGGPALMAFHSEGTWPAPRGPCHPAVGQALPPAPAAKARQHPCLPPSRPRHCRRHSPAVHRSFRGGF